MIVVKHKHPKNGTEEAGLPACPGFLRSQIKGLLGNILFGATMPLHRPPPVTLTFVALRGVQVVYHLEPAGKPVANWQPVSVETTDATGNRTAINYGPNGNQVQWNGDEGTFTYPHGLWPDEPAWKLRLIMAQI